MRDRNDRNRERGVSLFLGTISLVMIVPMIGLSIDVGILYVSKTRLQSAVDGAALAAARALIWAKQSRRRRPTPNRTPSTGSMRTSQPATGQLAVPK